MRKYRDVQLEGEIDLDDDVYLDEEADEEDLELVEFNDDVDEDLSEDFVLL